MRGTVSTVVNQQLYDFASINIGVPSFTGVQAVLNVRSLSYNSGGGGLWIPPRPWPWFQLYELNNATPQPGPPRTWAVFAQGAAPGNAGGQASIVGGNFYISPPPDDVYVLTANSACYPVPLVDDTTPEAIPYLWTDAVPFFAAYFALMSAQTNARMADAAQMYKGHYNEFMDRARKQANPDTGRWQYDQAQDPVQALKLGIKGGAPG